MENLLWMLLYIAVAVALPAVVLFVMLPAARGVRRSFRRPQAGPTDSPESS